MHPMTTTTEKPKLNPILKLTLDIGPLVLFFLANSRFGIFVATGAFMVAVVVALLVSYTMFGGILLGGYILEKPFLAILFDSMFQLTPEGWRKLTLRWALFFLALAVLNEVIWRTQSTDFWVNFKLFGFVPITFLFAALQVPLLTRYAADPASAGSSGQT